MSTAVFSTPLGLLRATLNDSGELTGLVFLENREAGGPPNAPPVSKALAAVTVQIEEYFRGKRRHFEIPLAPVGTEFQQRVWKELRNLLFGTTISYAELASRLGDPKAVRAVARANALNPICILIPCHRVIGSDGSLTGYAFGLERKRGLLKLEGAGEWPAQKELFR